MDTKFAFRTKWIEEEQKHCASLVCNGEVLVIYKFDSHQDMMVWISDTMSNLILCGEEWEFTYK